MAASHHSRSHSMPCELHPVVLRIEEELNKLKSPGAPTTPPTSPSRAQAPACTALAGLGRLHCCVEDLLRLPLAQQAFARHRHEKWVAEELDGSIRLLDLSGTARDLLSNMKEQVRDLESSLRRRGDRGVGKSVVVDAYFHSRRMAQRDVAECLAALKRTDAKRVSAPLHEQNCELSVLVSLLSQVRAATVSVVCSVLSLTAMPRSQARPSKWSLVSRAVRKGKVSQEGKHEDAHEVESAEGVLLSALSGRVSVTDVDGEVMARVQKQLEAMEVEIEGVVAGLEGLFRQLIQNRVSLLNTLSL